MTYFNITLLINGKGGIYKNETVTENNFMYLVFLTITFSRVNQLRKFGVIRISFTFVNLLVICLILRKVQ